MIDQPLLNKVPEGEPESLEVYELKQRIAELDKEGNEMSIIIADLRAHLKIRGGEE